MKATVKYDSKSHTVALICNDLMYVQLCSIILEEIKKITFFENGYFIADTNYGEEYFDFEYSLEKEEATGNKKYARRFRNMLKGLTAEDIKIEKVQYIYNPQNIDKGEDNNGNYERCTPENGGGNESKRQGKQGCLLKHFGSYEGKSERPSS